MFRKTQLSAMLLFHRQAPAAQAAAGAVTLTFPAVVGLAIGAGFLFCGFLTFVILFAMRRRDSAALAIRQEANERGRVETEKKKNLRSNRPPEVTLPSRLSFNPFMPLGEPIASSSWPAPSPPTGFENPPAAKAKRLLSVRKGFFQVTGARDSWPLVTNIPLSLRPGRGKIAPSPVAPPGYVIEDKPKRSGSRLSKRNNSVSSITLGDESPKSPTMIPNGPAISPYRSPVRKARATSETQLSTILRSTSERLTTTHQHSVSRTLSTIGRFPGLPPAERLPTPPKRLPTESREALVERAYPESPDSSIYDFLQRTPSPDKNVEKKSGLNRVEFAKSPTPSIESKDSMFNVETFDLIMPKPLSSPSKRSSTGERLEKDREPWTNSSIVARKARISVVQPDESSNSAKVIIPQRISLASDPFYSAVKSAKPDAQKQANGTRPYYIRKATFGAEASRERPTSFSSPPHDVSGNLQTTATQEPQIPTTDSAEEASNPFQWSPQELMTTSASQTSLKSPSSGKGHKRSNVMRMSGPPASSRPQSTVDAVPEEGESSLKLIIPHRRSVRIWEPVKSKFHSSSTPRSRSRFPPTSAVFEPTPIIPNLSPQITSSIPIGVEDTANGGCSPAYSFYSYPSDAQTSASSEKPPSPLHLRSHSASVLPSFQHSQLFSFPPPCLVDTPTHLPPPSHRSSVSAMTSILNFPVSLPAPPLLTMPIPAHLNGPRQEPPRRSQTTRSPRRDSVQASINLLRRMNSELTSCSLVSLGTASNSVTPLTSRQSTPLKNRRSAANAPSASSEGKDKVDDSINEGTTSPTQDTPTPRTRNHRTSKDQKGKEENKVSFRLSGIEKELTPVREINTPPSVGQGGLGKRFTFSVNDQNSGSPPKSTLSLSQSGSPSKRSKKDESGEILGRRFSELTPKAEHTATRRESRMEHPSPTTPPKVGLGLLGLAGQRLMAFSGRGGGVKQEQGLPGSLGVYDQEGFHVSPAKNPVPEEGEVKEKEVEWDEKFLLVETENGIQKRSIGLDGVVIGIERGKVLVV